MTDTRWDYNAVQRYIKLQAETLEHTSCSYAILEGQAPRRTESFSLPIKNTPIHPRGVYVYGGTIVLVTRYNKATRRNNRELQVARFLPLGAAEILFTLLVYMVPYSDILPPVLENDC